MRTILAPALLLAASVAAAQNATVSGQVVLKENGQPLGYTTISILTENRQLLTSETGKFILLGLTPGDVRLRFKRIGFAPIDTTLRIAANDTAKINVEMARLVIQLPPMVVSAKCTNETPTQPQPALLAELFDQVKQNAERVQLLAKQKPFVLIMHHVIGYRNTTNRIVASSIDTVIRRALPPSRYRAKGVMRRDDAGDWIMALPELPDFADIEFTSSHCFRYAGQTRWESDSVIKVEFEPVPALDKEVDIEGTMYLRVDNYQLVGLLTKLNKVPPQLRISGVEQVSVRAKFAEIVSGFPVLEEWELTTKLHRPNLPRIELGQMINLRWLDSTATKPDTVRLLLRPR